MSIKILLSPAKKLNWECNYPPLKYAQPALWNKTIRLAKALKKMSSKKIGALMNLSFDLAQLNYDRYQNFQENQNETISKPAAFLFNGEAYTGLNIESYNENELQIANEKLRILSGLYGVLKPLDFIQPYRLEMGTKLSLGRHKNLYEFWNKDINKQLSNEMKTSDVVVNLASSEYFKAAHLKDFKQRIITPVFKDFKNGSYKTIMVFAKKSRGAMSKYIIQNDLQNVELLKNFDVDGYEYNVNLSTENDWVFTRQ